MRCHVVAGAWENIRASRGNLGGRLQGNAIGGKAPITAMNQRCSLERLVVPGPGATASPFPGVRFLPAFCSACLHVQTAVGASPCVRGQAVEVSAAPGPRANGDRLRAGTTERTQYFAVRTPGTAPLLDDRVVMKWTASAGPRKWTSKLPGLLNVGDTQVPQDSATDSPDSGDPRPGESLRLGWLGAGKTSCPGWRWKIDLAFDAGCGAGETR